MLQVRKRNPTKMLKSQQRSFVHPHFVYQQPKERSEEFVLHLPTFVNIKSRKREKYLTSELIQEETAGQNLNLLTAAELASRCSHLFGHETLLFETSSDLKPKQDFGPF